MSENSNAPSRRDLLASSAALIGASTIAASPSLAQTSALAQNAAAVAPDSPPQGYNILFVLVDQEHFFPQWPFPVPAREWLKSNGITFVNHQAASCVCSPARSVIYTGLHIQHSGVFDNLNYLWQPDMSTKVKTIGDRLADIGYHAAYQGKWHLSYNLDQAHKAVDAPMADYRKIIESYGFKDFFGSGDIVDKQQGGYTFDVSTASAAITWMRIQGEQLRLEGKPWFLAVNFVNPHDVMYINSDLPGESVQGKKHAIGILPTPHEALYQARWDEVPLPATRSQPLDAPGRPKAHQVYQEIQDMMVGAWPNEDRRWRLLRNYYFNCIRDCDQQVMRVLQALKDNNLDKNTIVIFNADHGEMGGSHQMRGKGNCAYKEQNHVPLMIYHPAYPGGVECAAVTSHLDLAPTILGLTGVADEKRAKAATGLRGRDMSVLLKNPTKAQPDSLRPAALFNYNMLSYQDAWWAEQLIDFMFSAQVPSQKKIDVLKKREPDFFNRTAIRSLWDGRYRFSRYFSPLEFNTPKALEELLAKNDLELYDLATDQDEVVNLASDTKKNGELIMTMNAKLNALIADEVGDDDGRFLPLQNGRWTFPAKDQR
jgi:choline-sulfatase